MFDLSYPAKALPAKGYKDFRGNREGAAGRKEELVPVVEPNGIVTGFVPRSVCHEGRDFLHPVVHLHIIDRNERICLQKRGPDKDLYPGLWDTAVGGHVSYGENLHDALFREAGEELGFTAFNPVFLGTYVFESDTEKELVAVFATVHGPAGIKPDTSEVSEARFWKISEVEKAIGKGILTPQFEGEFPTIKEKLLALL